MSNKLQRLHADISESLNEIAALFDPKHTPKITLIVRTPWLEDGGVLMGNDDYDEALAEINRLRSRDPEPQAEPVAQKTSPQGVAIPSKEKIQGGFDVLLQIRGWIRMCRIPNTLKEIASRPSAKELEGFIAARYYEYEMALARLAEGNAAHEAKADAAPSARELLQARLASVEKCIEILWERTGREEYGHAKAAVTLDIAALEDFKTDLERQLAALPERKSNQSNLKEPQ